MMVLKNNFVLIFGLLICTVDNVRGTSPVGEEKTTHVHGELFAQGNCVTRTNNIACRVSDTEHGRHVLCNVTGKINGDIRGELVDCVKESLLGSASNLVGTTLQLILNGFSAFFGLVSGFLNDSGGSVGGGGRMFGDGVGDVAGMDVIDGGK